MIILEWSSLNKQEQSQRIYDPIRQEYLEALPEERVRQELIHYLIHYLGFPQSLIAVEKQIKEIPHLQNQAKLPNRRIDILCYAKDIHPRHALYPLLLIECKAVPLDAGAWRQIKGYNHYIRAPFLALANADSKKFTWEMNKKQSPEIIEYIPKYSELINYLLS